MEDSYTNPLLPAHRQQPEAVPESSRANAFWRHSAQSQFPGQLPVTIPPVRVIQQVLAAPINRFVDTETQIVVQENPSRTGLFIRNKSLSDVFVNFGESAANGVGERISAGGFYEPAFVPINAIYMWSSANAEVFILEGSPVS